MKLPSTIRYQIVVLAMACGVSALAQPRRGPSILAPSGSSGGASQAGPGEITGEEMWNMLADAMTSPASSTDDAVAFFKEHSPNRFEIYDHARDGGRLKSMLLDRMVARFNQIDRRRAGDPDLYNLLVKQLELQDETFGLIHNQQQPQDSKELREKVGELVDLSLKEREHRIEQLEKTLADLKSSLEQDKTRRDVLIDRHLERLKKDVKAYSEGLDQLRNRPRPVAPGR